ncbi:MAG: sugar phosphate isomerase/epimerase [Limnochordia bacterium]|nr:sugar phosphate isomerase/epimerase [Limnochordia bacterium]MDD2629255.1 sugar phosphate isomerase/epimerase [Limnochordia bacterium]
MSNTVIAAQLYTLRDSLKTPQEIRQSLSKVREIGYEAVQLSGLGPIEPGELAKILQDYNLQVAATHVSFQRLKDEFDKVVEEHRLWGCQHVAVGSMPGEYKTDADGYKRFAQEATAIGRQLARAGLTFSYHNHSFEFEKFQGRLGLDILFEESDPEVFLAEIDTFWIQHGGGDPAAWIQKVSGRMRIVHLKDMTICDGRQAMAEVGEGNLNWPDILRACKEAGVLWYVVEQDICQRDPFESLAISLRNLKAMGLV